MKFFNWLVGFCVLSVAYSDLGLNQTEILKRSEIILSLQNFSSTFLFDVKDVSVSDECKKALVYYGLSIKNMDWWALQMFDATSKLQSGILDGNIYNLGAYDECQSIRDVVIDENRWGNQDGQDNDSPTNPPALINGKYCLGKFNLTIALQWALCAPDACSAEDLNAIVKSALDLPLSFTETLCHSPSQDPKITTGDIILIVCFSLILAIMLASSAYDMYIRHFEKKSAHPLYLAFSMVTNLEKLFATKKAQNGSDQMECLSGIRSLSMMWVVIGHIFSNQAMTAMTNAFAIINFFDDNWTMYIRGATVSVDSFFLMSGIVMIYVYLKSTKDKQCFNVFLYYLHRYLRLTPALAAVLAVHLTVLKHFGSGPLWPIMNDYAFDTCQKYWWSVLLYIQNYANQYEMCIGQSWYLSVDTQLFFISPIFLLPLKRWPRLTLAAVLIATLASISAGFANAWVYKLVDINSMGRNIESTMDYMTKFYTATYTRASPWLIGIIVGYFIYNVKIVNRGRLQINSFLNIFMWIGSLSVLTTCVFYDASHDAYDRLASSSYIAFLRPAWALALSWVIFACVTGHGGPVNWLLSARVFQVLARLAYSMYLTHYTIILVLDLSMKQPVVFSNAKIMFEFWSVFMLVFLISVVWTLAFESPIIIIEKYLLGGGTKKKPETEIQKSNNQENGIQNGGVVNNGYVVNENKPNEGRTPF